MSVRFMSAVSFGRVTDNGEYTCRTTDREYGHGVHCYLQAHSSPVHLFFNLPQICEYVLPFSI